MRFPVEKLAVQEDKATSTIIFLAKIQPRASRDAIVGLLGESLKIALCAPPVDGVANEACIQFLATVLQVGKRDITILSGHTGRNKRIRVQGIALATFYQRISARLEQ